MTNREKAFFIYGFGAGATSHLLGGAVEAVEDMIEVFELEDVTDAFKEVENETHPLMLKFCTEIIEQ